MYLWINPAEDCLDNNFDDNWDFRLSNFRELGAFQMREPCDGQNLKIIIILQAPFQVSFYFLPTNKPTFKIHHYKNFLKWTQKWRLKNKETSFLDLHNSS